MALKFEQYWAIQSFLIKIRSSKVLFQIPRLSVLPSRYPLSVTLSVIPPAEEFGPHAPPEELDSTRAAGTN